MCNACMCMHIIELDLTLRSIQIFRVAPGNQDIG